jgi:hypothetical protein
MADSIHAVPFPKDELSFHALSKEQTAIFCETLKGRNIHVPYPQLASAIVAYAGTDMVGYVFCQLVPHAEPMEVKPEFRGTGLAEELADRMAKFMVEGNMPSYLVIAQNEFAAKLCEDRGMREVKGRVYVTAQPAVKG